jgi:hypothetical protein
VFLQKVSRAPIRLPAQESRIFHQIPCSCSSDSAKNDWRVGSMIWRVGSRCSSLNPLRFLRVVNDPRNNLQTPGDVLMKATVAIALLSASFSVFAQSYMDTWNRVAERVGITNQQNSSGTGNGQPFYGSAYDYAGQRNISIDTYPTTTSPSATNYGYGRTSEISCIPAAITTTTQKMRTANSSGAVSR